MMKRILFLLMMMGVIALNAQSVDYEVVGFLDAQDSLSEDLLLTADEDFTPTIRLKNNGPSVPAVSDTVYFDLYYNGNLATYFFLRGNQLQNVLPGQDCEVSLPQPLMTAETMDANTITAFQLCIEVRIGGSATDPVSDNNQACVQVNRPLPVSDYTLAEIRLWPNPVVDVCRIDWGGEMAENGPLQVHLFDLCGKSVAKQVIYDGEDALDMSALPAGMYLVRIENGQREVVCAKVMKQ